jgi:hypothetical protein
MGLRRKSLHWDCLLPLTSDYRSEWFPWTAFHGICHVLRPHFLRAEVMMALMRADVMPHSHDEVHGFGAIRGDLDIVRNVMRKQGLAHQDYVAPIVLREQDMNLPHCASFPGMTI